MPLHLIYKALIAWLAILVLAVVNGLVRESLLVPAFGQATAFMLSGLILSALILTVSYFALPWFGKVSPRRYLFIGVAWLLLTLAFEFAFGRFVQGQSGSQLLDAYTFKDGNIWPLVLLVTLLAPLLAGKLRGWI